ncbi:MAG: hypothetical protein NC187_09345 [Candidatus Amulumruptor caecigallinarius]|nr:hypothetical protein [Candidatus Amulumruptor caecigallinarius]MCM1397673.1 hypothetical protein [Candidatus Amulumruptor caecigallinarius]MCM1454698.1 hypothetical protein [bacterium]
MKITTLLAAGAVALAMSACTDSSKLAGELEGSWSGAPERFTVNEAATATMTPIYTFELGQDNKSGGDVTVAMMVSAIMPINTPTDGVVLPFQVTVSAVGTVEGSWSVAGDDLTINLNMNTLNVNVNPDNVTTADDALTDQTMSYWQTNRPAVAQRLENEISSALSTRLLAMRSFEDVKIKNDVMEYKLMGAKMYMHRDGTIQ